MNAKKQIISVTLIALMILIFLFRVLLLNLYSLAAERGFFIPKESNIFTFRVLQQNPGSGEWWMIGEDKVNLYALDHNKPGYYILKKTDLPDGVSELDMKSWSSAAMFVSTP